MRQNRRPWDSRPPGTNFRRPPGTSPYAPMDENTYIQGDAVNCPVQADENGLMSERGPTIKNEVKNIFNDDTPDNGLDIGDMLGNTTDFYAYMVTPSMAMSHLIEMVQCTRVIPRSRMPLTPTSMTTFPVCPRYS